MEFNPNKKNIRAKANQHAKQAEGILLSLSNNNSVFITDALIRQFSKKFAKLSQNAGQTNMTEELEEEIYTTLKNVFKKKEKK